MKQPFSERIGAAEVPKLIQLDGMSEALRSSIWNLIFMLVNERVMTVTLGP